jgi:hypothetical protein
VTLLTLQTTWRVLAFISSSCERLSFCHLSSLFPDPLSLSLFCDSRALPFVVLISLLTQTVKTASLLAAIAALDVEVIGEVLEETKERVELIKELRDKITCRTRGSNFTQQELLEAVFQEIDSDGSGEINKKEFQEMLVKL